MGKKCGKLISMKGKINNKVVPSFLVKRQYSVGEIMQFMWFYPNDATHTWKPNKSIENTPLLPVK